MSIEKKVREGTLHIIKKIDSFENLSELSIYTVDNGYNFTGSADNKIKALDGSIFIAKTHHFVRNNKEGNRELFIAYEKSDSENYILMQHEVVFKK